MRPLCRHRQSASVVAMATDSRTISTSSPLPSSGMFARMNFSGILNGKFIDCYRTVRALTHSLDILWSIRFGHYDWSIQFSWNTIPVVRPTDANLLQPIKRHSRHLNSKAFNTIHASKNCYKFSYFPRTIKDWNSLPDEIANITEPQQFKQALTHLFPNKHD